VNLKLKFTKNQKGLTLIELLVVIVILGIIAAIAMVMSNRDDAVLSTNEQNASILQDAVNRYYTMHGTYPSVLENLTKLPSGGNYKGGPYIESVPSV
jgi:prepilin-type N-terminal cleavage/methylation domain-containing protein